MCSVHRNYYHDPDAYDIDPLEEEILLRIGSDEDDSDISISNSLEDQLLSFTEEEISNQKGKNKKENFMNNEFSMNNSISYHFKDLQKVDDFKSKGHKRLFNFVLCETEVEADANNNQVNGCYRKESEIVADVQMCKDLLKSVDRAGIGNDKVKHTITTTAKRDRYLEDIDNFELDVEEKKMAQLRKEVDNILAEIRDVLNNICGKGMESSQRGSSKSDTELESVPINDLVSTSHSQVSSQESKHSLDTFITDNERSVEDSVSEYTSDWSEVDQQESTNSFSRSSIEIIPAKEHLPDYHHQDDVLVIDDIYDIWQAFYSDKEQIYSTCESTEDFKYQREEEFECLKTSNNKECFRLSGNELAYTSRKNSTVVESPKPRFIFINPAKLQTLTEHDIYGINGPEYEIELV